MSDDATSYRATVEYWQRKFESEVKRRLDAERAVSEKAREILTLERQIRDLAHDRKLLRAVVSTAESAGFIATTGDPA